MDIKLDLELFYPHFAVIKKGVGFFSIPSTVLVSCFFMKNEENKPVSINILNPGAAPVALSLARLAGIRETVDQFTGWSPNDRSTSPGILAESLVAAIICGCRPLYKVEHFWEGKAIEIFYKEDGITSRQLHDDAYARMLDKLASVDCRRMFETVCLTMLQHHSLDIVLTHSDTTSVSVEGIYELEEGTSAEDFKITHGHSKDHRPDLKQIKVGLSVQEEGLPLSGELLSGNKSDQVWNPEAVMELSKFVSGQGYEDVVFLADCALISTGSLLNLAKQEVQFISRLPETFNIAAELKEAAWNGNKWANLGQLAVSPKENAAVYRAWKTFREIEGEKFGFAVIHSSSLEERKEKTLAKEIERHRKVLCRKSEELKKQPFACETDANRSAEKLRKCSGNKGFDCEVSVSKKEEASYGHKGRPKRGEVPEIRISWFAEVKNFVMREAIVEEKKRMASTFVLIYRLAEDKSAEDILRSYKNQDKVEQGFKFLKQPLNLIRRLHLHIRMWPRQALRGIGA
ncbi:MAG: IS1634 family transposase [Synergistaceae bacterium]|nr:IS1634 family transposase [Synergistaceae bacterium]